MAADLIVTPFADQGDKTAPPLNDPAGFVNFTEGYTKYYEISLESGDPQAKAVERAIQNYLFNILTANTQLWQQLGISPWFPAMPGGYATNALVMRKDVGGTYKPYRSLVDANATDPNGNPATWEYVRTFAEITAKIPMPSGGLAGAAELISVATNLDNLDTGTYEIVNDAIALASVAPVSPVDTVPRAGMIECKRWLTSPGVTIAIQRYVDRNGIEFARGFSVAWTPWVPQVMLKTQGDTVSYALDTGLKNALDISTTLLPVLAARVDGMVLKIKVKVANDGACTLKDAVGTVPLVGKASPLQGGELFPNGEAWVQWNTSIGVAPGSYILMESSGGGNQVGLPTQTLHALQFGRAAISLGMNQNYTGKSLEAGPGPTFVKTANFKGAEMAVKTATGIGQRAWMVGNFDFIINLATLGQNGLDTGVSAINTWYAIYLMFNPTTGAACLLAQNAGLAVVGASTAGSATETYTGANAPAGFIASALISIVRTLPDGNWNPFRMQGRRVACAAGLVLTIPAGGNSIGTPFGVNLIIPAGARRMFGHIGASLPNGSPAGSTGSSVISLYPYLSGTLGLGAVTVDTPSLFVGKGFSCPFTIVSGDGSVIFFDIERTTTLIVATVAMTGYEI